MRIFFILLMVATVLLVIVSAVLFFLQDQLDQIITAIPEFPKSYSVMKLSCLSQDNNDSRVIITFQSNQKARHEIPNYAVKEIPEEGKTKITFQMVNEVNTRFLYNEIINNKFIEDLSYDKINDSFIVTIKRKGGLSPVEVNSLGPSVTITIRPSPANYPSFLKLDPEPDSAVFPEKQKIAAAIALAAPLKSARFYLNGRLQHSASTSLAASTTADGAKLYQYEIFFTQRLNKNEIYRAQAVVADEQNRYASVSWEFIAQLPPQRGALGADRFQYLGWWGQINTMSARVRKEPTTKSEIIGTLSTINRVKVLDEVAGERIEGNNHWYKIDGGAYAGGYAFSEVIDPIAQPQAPASFTVPQEVKEGEYWIDVDTQKEVFTLFLYDKPVFVTYVSTGRKGSETVTGTYRIYYKLLKKRMRDNPPNFEHGYDIPDVPTTMFYHGSYAMHGTFWHDRFGTMQSAGCTNMTQGDAKFIFDKVLPKLKENQKEARASADNLGTIVYNHLGDE